MIDVLTTPWAKAIQLEMKVAKIIQEQAEYGWWFDTDLAYTHIATLDGMLAEIDNRIKPILPKRRIPIKSAVTNERPFTKKGELSTNTIKWFGDRSDQVAGPYSKVAWEDMNLSSDSQVKEYLLSVGWEPWEWNYNDDGERTSPKLTEDSLKALNDPLSQCIHKRIQLEHRKSQIQGWVGHVRENHRIPADANTCGTNTGRMRHRTIVNVPKAKDYVFFGKQMRELFSCPSGRILLGVDAKGLENRMLGHYANDPTLSETLLAGDFHTAVLDTIRDYSSNRDNTKTIEYAFFYGAGDEKLGKIADIHPRGMSNAAIGREIRSRIMRGLPALGRLSDKVLEAARRGYLFGLDGRKVYLRGEHAALNTLLQSAGAIVMKQATCIIYDAIQGHDIHMVGNFHDEIQMELDPSELDFCRRVCYNSIIEAGKSFKLNIHLEGDVTMGKNWAETH